jgi:hypothetical protein
MPFFFGLSSPNILLDLRIHSSNSYFFHADFWLDLLKCSTKQGFECWYHSHTGSVEDGLCLQQIVLSDDPLLQGTPVRLGPEP